MRVLIDTPIWSLALRRKSQQLSEPQSAMVAAWAALVRGKKVVLVGPVRQELLSGVRDVADFDRLCNHLRAFDDEALTVEDYEEAARCFNTCRSAGVAGSNVDFLLCAAAIRRHIPIFTTDADFDRYAKRLPIRRYESRLP